MTVHSLVAAGALVLVTVLAVLTWIVAAPRLANRLSVAVRERDRHE